MKDTDSTHLIDELLHHPLSDDYLAKEQQLTLVQETVEEINELILDDIDIAAIQKKIKDTYRWHDFFFYLLFYGVLSTPLILIVDVLGGGEDLEIVTNIFFFIAVIFISVGAIGICSTLPMGRED